MKKLRKTKYGVSYDGVIYHLVQENPAYDSPHERRIRRNNRNHAIAGLYGQGAPSKDVAAFFGISRQRVHQIYEARKDVK